MTSYQLADKIVAEIVSDLMDRGGLSDEWDNIDHAIKLEIESTWKDIVFNSLVAVQTNGS